MDPDAVYQAQAEHDHEDERAAIADQRQWHAGNRQHRNRLAQRQASDARKRERESGTHRPGAAVAGAVISASFAKSPFTSALRFLILLYSSMLARARA